jgi:hypothetical protein
MTESRPGKRAKLTDSPEPPIDCDWNPDSTGYCMARVYISAGFGFGNAVIDKQCVPPWGICFSHKCTHARSLTHLQRKQKEQRESRTISLMETLDDAAHPERFYTTVDGPYQPRYRHCAHSVLYLIPLPVPCDLEKNISFVC